MPGTFRTLRRPRLRPGRQGSASPGLAALLAVVTGLALGQGAAPALADTPARAPDASDASYVEPVECPWSGPSQSHPTGFRIGDSGPGVAHLQCLLIRRGYAVPDHGVYDARTHQAVLEFCRAEGIGYDGMLGPRFWTALHR
ncbi:peptidoglycan-binding protein [Streptomyces sp. NPDC057438]|uniref:peptidoglycan-binding domain-containing protein n=1 Tax=Streptomyces sp. NPDC057438 TaxID=3346133 RepID=UPI0036BCBE18